MLDTSNLSKFLKGITDAIRAKKGTTEPIEHKLIDEEIASIENKYPENYIYHPRITKSLLILDSVPNLPNEITYDFSDSSGSSMNLGYGFSARSVVGEYITLQSIKFIGDFTKINAVQQLFSYQGKLITIDGKLDFSSIKFINYMSAVFLGCVKLKDVNFVKESIPFSISFSSSPHLSEKSIQSIIDGLAYVTTAQTLTLHADVKARLTEEQIAIINEKGWTLA